MESAYKSVGSLKTTLQKQKKKIFFEKIINDLYLHL